MDQITIEQLIRAKYSGSINEMEVYLNLAIQTAAVLVGGIVLWRISIAVHKKKQAQRVQNKFFETPYSKGWKSRR